MNCMCSFEMFPALSGRWPRIDEFNQLSLNLLQNLLQKWQLAVIGLTPRRKLALPKLNSSNET